MVVSLTVKLLDAAMVLNSIGKKLYSIPIHYRIDQKDIQKNQI